MISTAILYMYISNDSLIRCIISRFVFSAILLLYAAILLLFAAILVPVNTGCCACGFAAAASRQRLHDVSQRLAAAVVAVRQQRVRRSRPTDLPEHIVRIKRNTRWQL